MMQALSTAESGKRYTIKWMFGNKNVLDFLRQYDFKEGSIIDVIQQNRDWMMDAGWQSGVMWLPGYRCKKLCRINESAKQKQGMKDNIFHPLSVSSTVFPSTFHRN